MRWFYYYFSNLYLLFKFPSHDVTCLGDWYKVAVIEFCLTISTNCNTVFLIVSFQTDADRRFLAAKGSVPIGIGKSSHIKRAIIDKNARIGENVKVSTN